MGDPLLRVYRQPLGQAVEIGPPLARAMFSSPLKGAFRRCAYLGGIGRVIAALGGEMLLGGCDPLERASRLMDERVRRGIEEEAAGEVARAVAAAMERRKGHA